MVNIIPVLFLIALIAFVSSFLIWIVVSLLKKYKLSNVFNLIVIISGIVFLISCIAIPISMEIESTPLLEPEITTEEKEFFHIFKTENTDVDLGMFSLIILGEIDGKLTSTNDFIVFYRSSENEITEERIESENSKFIIVENAEDEKIVIENHTYYEQQNYYSPPKIEEDYVETHYKLYVTEKTFKEIFE